MSNYTNTKAVVAANVYTNNNNEVTAAMVKAAINEVIDTLIAGGYLYKGIATTSTNPGSPDANVFYLATAPGTYTNFGSLVVNDGEVCVLKYNGSWSKEVTGAATAAQVSQLREEVDGIKNVIDISEWTEHKNIQADLELVTNDNFRLSPVIQLSQGDIVEIKTSGKSPLFAMASCDSYGNPIEGLVEYNGDLDNLATYYYQAPSDMYVIASIRIALAGYSMKITTSKSLADIKSFLEAGYLYKGIATPLTNPGNPEGRVFYIAQEAGTYTYFDAFVASLGGVYLLSYDYDDGWSSSLISSVGSTHIPYDFSISDENKNVILAIIDGNIITKNFDSSKNSFPLHYSGRYLVRENTSLDVNGDYTTVPGVYASNRLSVKNAIAIKINSAFSVGVYYSDGYELLSGAKRYKLNNALAIVIVGASQDVFFDIEYTNKEDIDLSDYPLYYRIPVNQNRINLSGSDGQPTTEDVQYPLAVCYFANAHKSKKTVLLFGGFGKALTVDGWLSSTTGFTDFISELQENDFNVISVEGGRRITTSDIYREDIGGYVMPSLGNPLIMTAMNKAHETMVAQFGLNEDVGIVGCSQGGIGALNYNFLFGNIKSIVICGGLSQLELDGWDRQPQNVREYFNEWYGIASFDADAVRGYDAYTKIVSIGGTDMLINYPPLKCIYGADDVTAPYQNVEPFVDAVQNANGIAYAHIISGGTHATIAGLTDADARAEAIIWLNRFV